MRERLRARREARSQRGGPSALYTNSAALVVDFDPSDLRAAVSVVRADPSLSAKGNAAVYGLLDAAPLRSVSNRAVRDVLAGMYAPGVTEAPVEAAGGPAVERAAGLLQALRRRVRALRGGDR